MNSFVWRANSVLTVKSADSDPDHALRRCLVNYTHRNYTHVILNNVDECRGCHYIGTTILRPDTMSSLRTAAIVNNLRLSCYMWAPSRSLWAPSRLLRTTPSLCICFVVFGVILIFCFLKIHQSEYSFHEAKEWQEKRRRILFGKGDKVL